MKHAEGKAALRPRDLIVIKLHRIDGTAAELVILRIRSKDRTQQNARLGSSGMLFETTGMNLRMADS
jgi:hypothetical protein